MRIRRFKSDDADRTYDQSKDDFEIGKKSVLSLLDELMLEYEDFTKDVSPKNWRSTGSHFTDLRNMREEIEEFIPISVEEKENEHVKKHRNSNEEGSAADPSRTNTIPYPPRHPAFRERRKFVSGKAKLKRGL